MGVVKVRGDALVEKTAGWVARALRSLDEPLVIRFSEHAAPKALHVLCLAQKFVGVEIPITITSEKDGRGTTVFVVNMDGTSLRHYMRPAPERKGGNEKGAISG